MDERLLIGDRWPGVIPAIVGAPEVTATQQAVVRHGNREARVWLLPEPAYSGSVPAAGVVVSRRLLDLLGDPDLTDIEISAMPSVELTVRSQLSADLSRSWEVDVCPGDLEALAAAAPGGPWVVVANGPLHLLAIPRARSYVRSGRIGLNKFQRELLDSDVKDPLVVSLTTDAWANRHARRLVADRRRPHGHVGRKRGRRVGAAARTAWRGLGAGGEWLLRQVGGAPAMSMIVTWGPQGDDEETSRIEPDILPFLGVEEGDQMVVEHGDRRSLVTVTARGVASERDPPDRFVVLRGSTGASIPSMRALVAPELMISLPGPVRDDLQCFNGSVVRVQRKVGSIAARHTVTLMLPAASAVLSAAVVTGAWKVPSVVVMVVGGLYTFVASFRYRRAKRGPWPR